MSYQNLANYKKKKHYLLKSLFYHLSIPNFFIAPPLHQKYYDACFDLNNQRCYLKSNVREFSMDKHDTFYLEKEKYDVLKSLHDKGFQTFYINFFKNKNKTYDAILFNITRRIQNKVFDRIPIQYLGMNHETFNSNEIKTIKETYELTCEQFDVKLNCELQYINKKSKTVWKQR